MHNVSADRVEKEENKGRVWSRERERGRIWRGDGTFVRTSAATASDEARNVGKGRIRIFLGPRLNVIFRGATLTPIRLDNDVFWNREKKVLPYTVNLTPAFSAFTGIALISLHLGTRELDKEYRFLRMT